MAMSIFCTISLFFAQFPYFHNLFSLVYSSQLEGSLYTYLYLNDAIRIKNSQTIKCLLYLRSDFLNLIWFWRCENTFSCALGRKTNELLPNLPSSYVLKEMLALNIGFCKRAIETSYNLPPLPPPNIKNKFIS